MRCEEVREHLFAFLDSELDASRSVEVQHHLDHCAHCAREAEIERAISRHIPRALDDAGEAPSFDEGAILRLLDRGSGARRKGRPLLKRAAGVALLVVALAGTGGGAWWMVSGERAAFAALVVEDLRHVVEEGAQLQVASSDADRVKAWAKQTRGWEIEVPSPASATGRLIGARTCELAGRKTVLMLYEVEGALASLVVLPTERADLEGMERGDVPGRYIDRCRGRLVIAEKGDRLTYLAAGPCSRDELLRLLPGRSPDGRTDSDRSDGSLAERS